MDTRASSADRVRIFYGLKPRPIKMVVLYFFDDTMGLQVLVHFQASYIYHVYITFIFYSIPNLLLLNKVSA